MLSHGFSHRVGALWTVRCLMAVVLAPGCGDVDSTTSDDGDASADINSDEDAPVVCPEVLPYASEVVSFVPGDNAGHGQTEMPDLVLGPPAQGPAGGSSMGVVSLGVGGEIVLGFGNGAVVDGPGPDLIVWENPFWIGGNPDNPYAELGEVSVSEDGEKWHTFPCNPDLEDGYDAGCAGWRPRLEFNACAVVPLDPQLVGGDPFDLADLGLTEIRYVKIRDLSDKGAAPSAGFDLDAVGAVNFSID